MEFVLHDALMKCCMDFQNEMYNEIVNAVLDENGMK